MAYFSNGSEGMDYEAQYCNKCLNQENCTIWFLHLLYNYDQCGKGESAKAIEKCLDTLIPRAKDGLSNLKCTMFLPKQSVKQHMDAIVAAKKGEVR